MPQASQHSNAPPAGKCCSRREVMVPRLQRGMAERHAATAPSAICRAAPPTAARPTGSHNATGIKAGRQARYNHVMPGTVFSNRPVIPSTPATSPTQPSPEIEGVAQNEHGHQPQNRYGSCRLGNINAATPVIEPHKTNRYTRRYGAEPPPAISQRQSRQ